MLDDNIDPALEMLLSVEYVCEVQIDVFALPTNNHE
jgi:hypothetical protein